MDIFTIAIQLEQDGASFMKTRQKSRNRRLEVYFYHAS